MIFGCIWNGSSILFPCSPRPASGRVSYLMPVTYTPTYYTPALGYEENHRSEDWWFFRQIQPFPLKLSWLLIVAQQRISLPPSPHDAAGYEGQIWRASFGAVRGQNWGNQKQHRLTTQQFIDTNTAKQRRTRPEHNTLGGFLGTGGGNRTRTPSLAMDFESTSSTSSNTPAGETSAYQRTAQAIIQDEPEKGNRKKEFLWREIG